MDLKAVLLYIGLMLSLLKLFQLFPRIKMRIMKIVIVAIAFSTNLLFILYIDSISLSLSLMLFLLTVIFTSIEGLLIKSIAKNGPSYYFKKTLYPEILFFTSLDTYSHILLHIKSIYKNTDGQDFTEKLLEIAFSKKGKQEIRNKLYLHQIILHLLILDNKINTAFIYAKRIMLDLDINTMPALMLFDMNRVYAQCGDINTSILCLQVLTQNYFNFQYKKTVISAFLQFYALTGCRYNFEKLIREYSFLTRHIAFPYWQAVLLFRLGDTKSGNKLLVNFMKKTQKNVYKPVLTALRSEDNPCTPLPSQESEKALAIYPEPKSIPDEKQFFITKGIGPGIVILCSIIGLITIIQFCVSKPVSILDFFLINHLKLFDFLEIYARIDINLFKEPWVRWIVFIFLHADWLHLLLNLVGLYSIGVFVEKAYGKVFLFLIFLISAFAGNAATHLFHPEIISIGASGGVFGVFSTLIVFVFWYRKTINKNRLKQFFLNIAIIFGINILFGIQNPQINNTAHLCGFMCGIIISLLFMLLRKLIHRLHERL